MPELATPLVTPLPAAPPVGSASAGPPLASGPAPAPRRSRWSQLTAALADTHRASVPF